MLLEMPVKLGVEPSIGDQLLVIALLCDATAIENEHPISLLHRR